MYILSIKLAYNFLLPGFLVGVLVVFVSTIIIPGFLAMVPKNYQRLYSLTLRAIVLAIISKRKLTIELNRPTAVEYEYW